MQTVIVQLTHQKALRLLEELEEMHILKVLKKNINPDEKLSDKYSGKLSSSVTDKLTKHIDESRREWNDNS